MLYIIKLRKLLKNKKIMFFYKKDIIFLKKSVFYINFYQNCLKKDIFIFCIFFVFL